MAATESAQAAARAADDLYRRHGSEVYRYAFAVLGNHADAEDVTQTTFLNAYRSLEQGVRPRKPSNWLLVIAGNAIKQRFRQASARPREVALDDRVEDATPDDAGPTVGEVLTALSRIPPHQRQAIVLREFEGRSYREIADILGVTTSALETLLFRARRSLADELENQLTCADAQFAISQAADGRLARKEKRRLRRHVGDCPDCARFARLQQRQRRALRRLTLVPAPVSFSLEGSANAAALPVLSTGATASVAASAGGGALAGGVVVKVAAVVAAAGVAGGVGVVGAAEVEPQHAGPRPALAEQPGEPAEVARTRVAVPARGGAATDKNASPAERGRRLGQSRTAPARGQVPSAPRTTRGRGTHLEAPRGQGSAGRTSRGRSAVRGPRPGTKPDAAAEPRRGGPAADKPRTARGDHGRASARPERRGNRGSSKAADPPRGRGRGAPAR